MAGRAEPQRSASATSAFAPFAGLWRGASALLPAEPFDAVFITIYPTYPALLGPLLKRRFTFAFVLDYQDPGWASGAGRWAAAPDGASRLQEPR